MAQDEKKYYLIYGLVFEEGEDERIKEVDVVEVIHTDLSVKWVREYATENYSDSFASVVVVEVEDVTEISAPSVPTQKEE